MVVEHARQHHILQVAHAEGLVDARHHLLVGDGHHLLPHRLPLQKFPVARLAGRFGVVLERP